MNPNQIENLAKLLLDGCYVFETEQFNDVLEKLIGIYKIKNSIYYLEKMSESNDFSIIFSLSYIPWWFLKLRVRPVGVISDH